MFSYLLSGMIVYGALGWVLGRWVVHSTLLFPIGMVVGLALAVVLVILRFGRPGAGSRRQVLTALAAAAPRVRRDRLVQGALT